MSRPALQFRWAAAISEEEWATYRLAIETVRATGLNFMLGGGFALAAFTGRWRDTKDIDFYILPQDREAVVGALTQAGFTDYFPRLSYDRKWIYRSTRADVIVDIIWAMANQRAQVDAVWFEHAPVLSLRNQQLLVIPPEEFVWCKLYIMQRDHCDWTDIFNLLYADGPQLNWEHLMNRLEEDLLLLKAMLTMYGWLCPQEAAKLPDWVWQRLDMPPFPVHPEPPKRDRIRLLDSRRWFAGHLSPGDKLDV